MTPIARNPIDLTVIGGFLGSGKTTLLNQLLREGGDRRLAVLVNDFGAINIDAELVESRDGEMVRLENGCICCSVGGDFIGALALLRDGDNPPEHVVVEASGVADPGAIAVLGDMPGYRRDAAVVVADAETVRTRGEDAATRHQIISQVRAADLLVLNKTDLVEPAALADTRAWLREIAGPSTAIVETAFGALGADVVLGAVRAADRVDDDHHHDHDHAHPAFESWSWTGEAPVNGAGLVAEIQALPDGIVRAKGLLHLREDPANRYVLQVVGKRFSVEADRPWGDATAASQIVVIGLPGTIDEAALAAALERLTA
jgi:G3E family GTPase